MSTYILRDYNTDKTTFKRKILEVQNFIKKEYKAIIISIIMRKAENLSLKPQIIITKTKQILMPLLQKKKRKNHTNIQAKFIF